MRYAALSWSEHDAAADARRGLQAPGLDGPPLAALARPRRLPRPSVAPIPAAQRADAEGAHLRADRRARRGRHDLAAGDARGRAQLGLPLHLDPRLDVHALGALQPRLRLGGKRLLLLHRRRRRRRGGKPPDHVRHRRGSRAARVDARPSERLRGRPAGPHRQRRVQAAPARRLGRAARLVLPAHEDARPAARADLADPRPAGRAGASRTGASPTRASGRSAASRSTSPRRRSCAGSRRTAARGWPRSEAISSSRPAGRPRPTRSRPTSAPTASTSAASSASTTARRRSTRRCC